MKTYAYGFPRLGRNREYKKTIESFWKNEISEQQLKEALDKLQGQMLVTYEQAVDKFPVGEITGYDLMFDTAIMLGVYKPKDAKAYYELCRGKEALEMTKWFNTNYHYLVPDFSVLKNIDFKLRWNKPQEYARKFGKGIPALIGPFTFLKLCKGVKKNQFAQSLTDLAEVYKEIIGNFTEVHIEEPAFVMELSADDIKASMKAYAILGTTRCRKNLITYYDSVDFLKELYTLPVDAIGLDFVHGEGNLEAIKKIGFPKNKTLIAGLVDGRNVWKTDIRKAVGILKTLASKTSSLVVSNAAPLYHLPISLEGEKLAPALLARLSFAEEKLREIGQVVKSYQTGHDPAESGSSDFGKNLAVQARVKKLGKKDFVKATAYANRIKLHAKVLNLPLFPTTTIGSFPQTAEVREARADFRAGRITEEQYKTFVRGKIKELIRWQEEMGFDVLVHGEFERTDMVEFFAEKLEGITTTAKGWIISYGTRVYRPPIIFGDVFRAEPMTVDEITYAQSLTQKPVKGMLTGPVTIIAWSFVREDIPIAQVAYQLGLALQDEIRDYEKAGIKVAQIDEPAIREKAPIKRKNWKGYFDWAIKSFRLATNTSPETQIHTHMCYSEFGEIVKQIDDMDFDVISIETTRSRGDIIGSFEKVNFKRQIGLGVWDIHSPAVPKVGDMRAIVKRALKVIPKQNFWINPDCGLKTRNWEETKASLKNLILLTHDLRQGTGKVSTSLKRKTSS